LWAGWLVLTFFHTGWLVITVFLTGSLADYFSTPAGAVRLFSTPAGAAERFSTPAGAPYSSALSDFGKTLKTFEFHGFPATCSRRHFIVHIDCDYDLIV
jgi:hypothetical protein